MNTRLHAFIGGLFLALLLGGCITSVSQKSPFNQYVGKPLKTQRTTILYTDGAWDSNAEMLLSPPKQALCLREPPGSETDYRNRNRVATLPPGQDVRLLDVRQEVGDGIVEYDAIGEVYVPGWKRVAKFHHTWGAYDKIWRAPWESSTVPAVRSP
jgi:hypothetical protein